MKASQDKYHLIVSDNENVSLYIGSFEIKNTNCGKLRGIKIVMSELFHQKVNHYDLRNPYEFSILNINIFFMDK